MSLQSGVAFIVCSLMFIESALGQPAGATVRVRTRDELQQAVAGAKPGTRIVVAPGNYAGGLSFAGLRGEKDRPIVVAGEDPTEPPVVRGGGSVLPLSHPGAGSRGTGPWPGLRR